MYDANGTYYSPSCLGTAAGMVLAALALVVALVVIL